MEPCIQRFTDRASLVTGTASMLLTQMILRQHDKGHVSLCLAGGDLANDIYDEFALIAPDSALKPDQIYLWWAWDCFVATDDPQRNSLQALSRLAGSLALDPAKIHPMPSASTTADSEAGAAQYSLDLAGADIDICLTQVRVEGQIAGIHARHLGEPLTALVAAVSDTTPQIMTLTRAGLNSAQEIWILASGAELAETISRACNNDPGLPASYLTGEQAAIWMADIDALRLMPFHECTL